MAHRGETEIDPNDRDERLGEAIEAYLEQAESGSPPDPESFAASYPDLGADLVAALEGLALVQGLVGDSGGGGLGHGLQAGRRVAGYRIVRELGRGGMGIVYEAVHVGLDRPVALKVLGSSAAPDSTARRRFLNEAKTAAGLHHTHIVPVFDVGQVGGLCYYAMQRIEGAGLDRVLRLLRRDRTVAAGSTYGPSSPRPSPGGGLGPISPAAPTASLLPGLGDETRSWANDAAPSLSQSLSRSRGWGSSGRAVRGGDDDGPPPFQPPRGGAYYRWVADLGRQAAEALGHAHHQGVIHRDIKPSNLLIDGRGAIWVADFGLARRLADPSQTQVDSLLGTPRYMSPEQARTGAIDGRSDVYSLGATLYELVTLRPPFDGKSAAELVEQISGREVPRPRRFDPRVPLDLETILLKALAKRPDDRYLTADDLADDLGRFLRMEPVRARRIGPVGRLWRFARRHPGGSLVTTTAVVSVLTVATVAYVRIIDERNQARRASAEAKQARSETEQAYLELKKANTKTQASVRGELASLAKAVQVSNDPDRRSRGLGLLQQAAGLQPDADLRLQLRDQALGFLAIRDVEALPSIPAPHQHNLVFSPDGRRIAAIDEDGLLNLWDLDRRELADASREPVGPRRYVGNPPRPRGGIKLAGLGALGQLAVIRPKGDGLRFFEAAAPSTRSGTWAMPGRDLNSVLATPTGNRFLLTERIPRPAEPGDPDGDRPGSPDRQEETRVTLWSRDQPDEPRATLALPEPSGDAPGPRGNSRLWIVPAIAPDGSTVAVAERGGTQISLWDGDGTPLPPISVEGGVSALALGAGGALAIAEGGRITLWDLSPRRPLTTLTTQQGFIYQLRFSPGSAEILAASGWGGVELWNLATHGLVASLPTREPVDDLAFSPQGRTLAASHAKSISTWSVVEPVGQVVLAESPDSPSVLSFSPDGPLAIASRDSSGGVAAVRVWEGAGRPPTAIDTWGHLRASALGFDDQGLLITVGARELSWTEPPDPVPVDEVAIPEPPPREGLDRWVEGPRPRAERPSGPPAPGSPPPGPGAGPGPGGGGRQGFRTFAPTLAQSGDGRTLAFSRYGEVLVWHATRPDRVARVDLPQTRDTVMAYLALSRDGSRLTFASILGAQVQCVTLDEGLRTSPAWVAPSEGVLALTMDRTGTTVAVAERGGKVTLLDAATGAVRGRIVPHQDDPSPSADSLAFSPDGRTLAIGGRDHVRLVSVAGVPTPLAHLPGPRGRVRNLAFDAEGTHLAGADENRSIRVWDLATIRSRLAKIGLDW